MSISKSQAELIATNFLDSLGSGKEGLVPKETATQLILLAGDLIDKAQENLINSNSNASGKLSSSIEADEPIVDGPTVRIDIAMNYYGEFIDKGVRGTKSGSGQYVFKSDYPPKKMVDSIKNYISTSGKKVYNTNSKKTISKNEQKNSAISQLANMAYATSRSILQHGIKKTGFMTKAIQEVSDESADKFQQAFKIDVINSLPDKL